MFLCDCTFSYSIVNGVQFILQSFLWNHTVLFAKIILVLGFALLICHNAGISLFLLDAPSICIFFFFLFFSLFPSAYLTRGVLSLQYTSLKPLGDRVLVKIKTAEEKTVGGILLPTTAQTKPQGGEVVAVGEGKTIGKNKLDICVKVII